jgi:soluble cytochrome b562
VAVNFDPKHIEIFKEIKTFAFTQPKYNASIFSGKHLGEFYPDVVLLQESILSYLQASAKIDAKIVKLLAEKKRSVMKAIEDGFSTNWVDNNRKVDKYAKDLAVVVLELSEMQNEVSQEYQLITTTIQSLASCPLETTALQERLDLLQKSIDKFSTHEVSNLHILIP